MSSSLCVRCLTRSLSRVEASSLPPSARRAAFSTSASLSANPPSKKPVNAKSTARQGRTLRLAKNKRATTARPPAVGERRNLRKRVVLSNSNALDVAGLQNLTRDTVGSQRLRAAQGTVLGLQDDTVDALRALDAFKPNQAWSLFRRPACLVRKETVDLAADLEWIQQDKEGRTVRKVLFGERGSGKSVLQLQALAMASLKGWVLVHVPEAKDLTNAHTSYQPISAPEGIRYIQPHYIAKLLDGISKANQPVLSKLRLSRPHELPVALPPDATLARLSEIGARDPDLAWPVWQALWSELLSPQQNGEGLQRPPVMFTMDAVDHVMRLSSYLDSEAEPIHAHELAVVQDFVNLLSGKTVLPNGGMVLAATSESNRAAAHTLDQALMRNFAIQNTSEPPSWDPYVAYDKWVQHAMDTVAVQKLEGLSKEEARGIMEYYARSGMLRSSVTDGSVSEQWTLAGGGIIGQIEKGTVRARF